MQRLWIDDPAGADMPCHASDTGPLASTLRAPLDAAAGSDLGEEDPIQRDRLRPKRGLTVT